MAEAPKEETTANNLDLVFDDFLLIKSYDMSVNLTQEELAKRLADSKNTVPTMKNLLNEEADEEEVEEEDEESDDANDSDFPKVGGYVRSNYIDGIDYEAEVLSINEKLGMAHIKYIGYENEENVEVSELVPSWGKKARQKQYDAAKAEATDSQSSVEIPKGKSKNKKKVKSGSQRTKTPTMPLMPPMPSFKGMPKKDCEHLHAMLKSWYLSGYYTGIFEGVRMNQQEAQK